ncbi:MAG: helix-turn-helix transcriptional regulator [Lachnospiraceae bacterium]|nr:helix-turn-helix transcriptional regulator [Lachnospiraceae bacterium]
MEYRIKECREEAGMSQEELAKKSGVSRTIISGLESGSITTTTTKTLLRIAEALGLKVSDIFLN